MELLVFPDAWDDLKVSYLYSPQVVLLGGWLMAQGPTSIDHLSHPSLVVHLVWVLGYKTQ